MLGGAVEAPKPKKSRQRDVDFAEGGSSNAMAGKGDRTRTSPADAAAPQRAGATGHRTDNDTKKFAKGGEKTPPVGGVAFRAVGGAVGTGPAVPEGDGVSWKDRIKGRR